MRGLIEQHIDPSDLKVFGTDAANMLLHVVNERHRRKRAMIFTTNKSLKAWGQVLHDEYLAQAIIDRVLERGRLFRLDSPSLCTLHVNLDDTMNQGSDQDTKVARLSGTHISYAHHSSPASICRGTAIAAWIGAYTSTPSDSTEIRREKRMDACRNDSRRSHHPRAG